MKINEQLRNRKTYFLLILITIIVGLFSRSSMVSTTFIRLYVGDILYALMYFWMLGFVFPKMSSLKVLFLCLAFCYMIEISQLYQADWINEVRNYRLGGLILGFGFLWSDLICYTIGGLIGLFLEMCFLKK